MYATGDDLTRVQQAGSNVVESLLTLAEHLETILDDQSRTMSLTFKLIANGVVPTSVPSASE